MKLKNRLTRFKSKIDNELRTWGLREAPATDSLYPLLHCTRNSLLTMLVALGIYWNMDKTSPEELCWIAASLGFIAFTINLAGFAWKFHRFANQGDFGTLQSISLLFHCRNNTQTIDLSYEPSVAFHRVLLALSKLPGAKICAVDELGGSVSAGIDGHMLKVLIIETGEYTSRVEIHGRGTSPAIAAQAILRQHSGLLDEDFRIDHRLPRRYKDERLARLMMNGFGLALVALVATVCWQRGPSMECASAMLDNGFAKSALQECDSILARNIIEESEPAWDTLLTQRAGIKQSVAEDDLFNSRLLRKPDSPESIRLLNSALGDLKMLAFKESSGDQEKIIKARILAWKGDFDEARAIEETLQTSSSVPSLNLRMIEQLSSGNMEAAYANFSAYRDKRALKKKILLVQELSKRNGGYKTDLAELEASAAELSEGERTAPAKRLLILFLVGSALGLVTYQLRARKRVVVESATIDGDALTENPDDEWEEVLKTSLHLEQDLPEENTSAPEVFSEHETSLSLSIEDRELLCTTNKT